jgi:parallel beta-helix repeat protein
VSPAGSDTEDGSESNPWATIGHAFALAQPGDCIFVRGGTYNYSSPLRTQRSGNLSAYIGLVGYPGEQPALDFSGETVASDNGVAINHSYWYVADLVVRKAKYNGIRVYNGNYNVIERCVAYQNGDTGISIGGTTSAYNQVLNCDSYENYDPEEHGQDADGFGVKFGSGAGNYLFGCRAWNNSDDGYDLWKNAGAVLIDNCWAFENGLNLWGDTAFEGNGNGIKLGGDYIFGPHLTINCVAFGNANKGFDQNNNTAPLVLYNCTSWDNHKNFGFWANPQSGSLIFANNISYASRTTDDFRANIRGVTNSWQGFTVSTADFVNLDVNLARAARQADGNLPVNGFLRLVPTSGLVDKGTDVGFPFNGLRPDLGAFEY